MCGSKGGNGGCSGGQTLIFACSGAADVGAIADRAARLLAAQGHGRMSCIAGLGAQVPEIMDAAKGAGQVLAIDGCVSDCARLCLEGAGIGNFAHLQLADLGMEKSKSPICQARVERAVRAATGKLRDH